MGRVDPYAPVDRSTPDGNITLEAFCRAINPNRSPTSSKFQSMAARNALLKYLRVNVQLAPQNAVVSTTPFSALARRFFSDEVRGSFLDKSEVTDRVINVVKNFQKVDPAKVTPEAHFQNDLGLDSLDAVEVVMALEEEFGFEIPDNEADKINSIKLAVDFIASHPQAK